MANRDGASTKLTEEASPATTAVEPSGNKIYPKHILAFAGVILAALTTVIGAILASTLQKPPRVFIDNRPPVSNGAVSQPIASPNSGVQSGPVAKSEPAVAVHQNPLSAPNLEIGFKIGVAGNISSTDAERLKASVLDGLGSHVTRGLVRAIAIQCTFRDGEPLIGDLPVAVLSATWTLAYTHEQSRDGAIRAIEVFGTSMTEARSAAVDSAGALIAKRIITQLQFFQR